MLAFPFYVLVIALVFVVGPGTAQHLHRVRPVGWVVVLPASSAARCSSPSDRSTSLAARAGGSADLRILLRHLLPNVITQAVVYAMTDIVLTIVAIVDARLPRARRHAADPRLGLDDPDGRSS